MMNTMKRVATLLMVVLLIAMAAPVASAASWELDTERLQELMNIASRLQKENFTADSWNALDTAVTDAHSAMESGSQYKVDSAAGKMAKALSNMVSMDFTALNASLNAADSWASSSEEIDSLWDKMLSLLSQEQEARLSGNQEKVDQLSAQIDAVLAQLKAATGGTGSKTDSSAPWVILFAVSLLFNGALVSLMLLRTRKVKKCQKDDVPLVEYDIEDDLD